MPQPPGSPWLRRIAAPANLRAAWRAVRKRRGGAGVDGMTVAAFAAHEAAHLRRLERELLNQSYAPRGLRRVDLPKRHGLPRHIGVPCVADRVVQQAMLRVLGPHFEPTFCDCNYGFRVGRSAHQAVQAVAAELAAGASWVVETDIADFFPSIPWPGLRRTLATALPDEAVLDLIGRFIRAGFLQDTARHGVPQGAGCSPLLANVYLTPFDRLMMDQPGVFVRYGDDMVGLYRSRRAAQAGLDAMREVLERELQLRLHPGKTRLTPARRQGFAFLSFYFDRRGVRPSPAALQRFRDRAEAAASQHRGQTEAVLAALNPLIRGWGEYFKIGDVAELYGALDAWLASLVGPESEVARDLASLRAIKRRRDRTASNTIR